GYRQLSLPMLTPSPTTQPAPIDTPSPSFTSFPITAEACTPGAWAVRGLKSCDTRAKYRYGESHTMRGSDVRSSDSCDRITAEARVAASLARCFGLARKVISPAAACSSDPTWLTRAPASPATRPPR